MNVHKDVLRVIQNDYFLKAKNGEPLTQTELLDLISINNEITDQEMQRMDIYGLNLKEFEERHEELRTRHLLTFKIFNGFLQMHDLEYEFDNYYERILRKITN